MGTEHTHRTHTQNTHTEHTQNTHTHTHTHVIFPRIFCVKVYTTHTIGTRYHTPPHTHHIVNLCTVQTPSIISTLCLLLSLTFLHYWINDFNPIASLFLLFLFSRHKLGPTYLPIIISGKINVQL